MTDKQIIFDDVDVKDCIAYAKLQEIYLGNTLYKQMEKVCMVKNMPCKFFDCQFKVMARELKAKEQECENNKIAYQMELDIYNQECLNLQEELKAKEQECERLKHDNGYEVGALERTIDNLKADNKHLNDLLNQALKDYDKTRETLTEIKEIAQYDVYTPHTDLCIKLNWVKKKISEYEGNNEYS